MWKFQPAPPGLSGSRLPSISKGDLEAPEEEAAASSAPSMKQARHVSPSAPTRQPQLRIASHDEDPPQGFPVGENAEPSDSEEEEIGLGGIFAE